MAGGKKGSLGRNASDVRKRKTQTRNSNNREETKFGCETVNARKKPSSNPTEESDVKKSTSVRISSSTDAKKKKNQSRKREASSKTSDKTRQIQVPSEKVVTESVTLDRDRAVTKLQLQRYTQFTREAVTKGVKGILQEYNTFLKPFVPPGITRTAFDANPKKNRYADVVCIDGSRVILKNHPTDYIHANYVRGDPLINTFICTQGAMMDTVKDFWKMISQENVGDIIMLCETVEQGKEKCQQYWPREQGCSLEWPGILVRNVKVDNSDSTATVSTLELTFQKNPKITLKHHHWTTWPDKSVPQSLLAPFRLLKKARNSSRPTVVHCSAGIGRTGTVVALEICYQQLLSESKLSVLESVKALRSQRMHAVQTELQYLYLFKCLLKVSEKSKLIPTDCQKAFELFEKQYQALLDAKMAEEKPNEDYAPLMPLKKR